MTAAIPAWYSTVQTRKRLRSGSWLRWPNVWRTCRQAVRGVWPGFGVARSRSISSVGRLASMKIAAVISIETGTKSAAPCPRPCAQPMYARLAPSDTSPPT